MAGSANFSGANIGSIGQTLFGGFQASSGFMDAADSTAAAAAHNLRVLELNTKRQIQNLGRQTSRLVSTQRAQAASAMGIGSQAALDLHTEALRELERRTIEEVENLSNRGKAVSFEAEQRIGGFTQQAAVARGRAITGVSSNVFGNLFG